MLAATHSAPVRSSAARAAHRELRSLLRLFRANYACGICARTPWRMARYRVVQTSASRAALAPTFVSGQLFLGDLRASALAHVEILRRTNKTVARAYRRRDWPETNVGASAARDAPRGRRSISQALQRWWRTHLIANALSKQPSPPTTATTKPQKQNGETYRPPRFYIATPPANHSALRVTRPNDFLPAWHT